MFFAGREANSPHAPVELGRGVPGAILGTTLSATEDDPSPIIIPIIDHRDALTMTLSLVLRDDAIEEASHQCQYEVYSGGITLTLLLGFPI
jgi:hypothetical protein